MDEWAPLEEFPGYSVSQHGKVINNSTQTILRQSTNQQGHPSVGLFRDRVQYKRSVALLVAKAFLPEPMNEHFDTPIHLDGDKTNNHVANLLWRPRWFAFKYNQMFKETHREAITVPIRDIKTGVVYPDGMSAAVEFGILDKDILLSIANNTFVFPTWQRFEFVDD